MRILVCGSRTFSDQDAMTCFLHGWLDVAATVLIHGAAKGADTMAAAIAEHYSAATGDPIAIWPYPADWRQHGKAAGPIRNQQMLTEGKPDVVIAFVDKPLVESLGTYDMVSRAKRAGVPVYVVEAK